MEIKIKKFKKLDIRLFSEMKNILYDRNWARKQRDFEVYHVYRGVKERNGLTYDITLIPPKMLGKEFIKTKGHYHQKFSEIYIVLEGKAIFLIQEVKRDEIKDVYAIEAKKEDVIVVPPNYDHLKINPSPSPLKVANWMNKKAKSIFSNLEKMHGACYYYTLAGWIKNKNYKIVPKLRFEKPLKSIPKNLDFLKSGYGEMADA